VEPPGADSATRRVHATGRPRAAPAAAAGTRPQRICWSEVMAGKPVPAALPSGMIFARPCRRELLVTFRLAGASAAGSHPPAGTGPRRPALTALAVTVVRR
jgi:hypothetical protein